MKECKILLIDDEEELVTTLVERLSIRGIDSEAVMNGHDALERMCESKFNVVVADLKMPGLSGEEVIEVINSKFPDVKIILITGHGHTDTEEREEIMNRVSEVLMKPFDINDLIQAIQRVLNC